LQLDFNLEMSDPYSLHGGTVVAMRGKDCFCIANDLRLGSQMSTIATNVQKVLKGFYIIMFVI